MNSNENLLEIGIEINKYAGLLCSDTHNATLTWFEKKVFCDLNLNDLKKNLQEVDQLISYGHHTPEKVPLSSDNPEDLVDIIQVRAELLYQSFAGSNFDLIQACYRNLLVGIEQFEELTKKIQQEEKKELEEEISATDKGPSDGVREAREKHLKKLAKMKKSQNQ